MGSVSRLRCVLKIQQIQTWVIFWNSVQRGRKKTIGKTRQRIHIAYGNKDHVKVHLVKFKDQIHKSSRVWISIWFRFRLHSLRQLLSLLAIEHNKFELSWMSDETITSIHFEAVCCVHCARIHFKGLLHFWCISFWAKINKDNFGQKFAYKAESIKWWRRQRNCFAK